jgi:hypothetical protein
LGCQIINPFHVGLGTHQAVTTIRNLTGCTFESELQRSSRIEDLPRYEFGPFDGSFFLEWSLLEVRAVAFRSRVGILLAGWRDDDPVNSALVVFDRVTESRVTGARRARDLTAWTVGGTTLERSPAGSTLRFLDASIAENEVAVTAERVEIRLGHCEEMTSAPPDFSALTPEEAMAAMPGWTASFVPMFASATSAWSRCT